MINVLFDWRFIASVEKDWISCILLCGYVTHESIVQTIALFISRTSFPWNKVVQRLLKEAARHVGNCYARSRSRLLMIMKVTRIHHGLLSSLDHLMRSTCAHQQGKEENSSVPLLYKLPERHGEDLLEP